MGAKQTKITKKEKVAMAKEYGSIFHRPWRMKAFLFGSYSYREKNRRDDSKVDLIFFNSLRSQF